MNSTIDGLVRDGLLEAVVADPKAARQIIEESRSRLRQLNQMRQHRNRSEYAVRSFSAQETKAAIDLAGWIIEFAATRLR